MKKLLYIIGVTLCALSLASCSEDDGSVEEYAQWQTKNETYWDSLYAATQQKVSGGDASWRIYRQWSLGGQTSTTGSATSYGSTSHIVVHVEQTGTGTATPQYTDSVQVHYRGHLIPSATYTSGYVFDQSWTGDYNLQTMKPTKLAISGVVDGFATALLQMHEGDRWTVYMPYQLAYGTSTSSSSTVPAYSTLIFDLTLVKICK